MVAFVKKVMKTGSQSLETLLLDLLVDSTFAVVIAIANVGTIVGSIAVALK